MTSKTLFSILFVLISTTTYANNAGIKVIYGDDNRVDVIDSNNSLYIKLAKSTAAMIEHSDLREFNAEQMEVVADSLESRGICSEEPFAQQPTAANCSGFLVGKNVLVTAGHCIRTQLDCDKYAWVFDFKVEYKDQSEVVVGKKNVYSCSKIISRSLDSESKMDYAVIELTSDVEDRSPLKFRTTGAIQTGEPLVVIGHPTGLPTKIADGASVRSTNDVFLVANLDTYGGNSGSAVFNAVTGVIEGILVRGENDYVYDSSKGCRVSNHLGNEEGRGEDVTLITAISGLPQVEVETEQPTDVEEPGDHSQTGEVEGPSSQTISHPIARLFAFLRRIFG